MKMFASAAIAAVLAGSVTSVAYAQDPGVIQETSNFTRDHNVSVRERPRPDYEAGGIKSGGFTLYPRVTVEAEYNDNIYATATDEESDTIWRVKPEIAARSNWARHALGFFASGTINRYADNSTENTEEYTVGANGRLDVVGASNIIGSVQYQSLTEPRTSPDSPSAAAKPVEYKLLSSSIVGTKEFNRLRVIGRIEDKDYNYDDATNTAGGNLDQDFRDRNEIVYGGRAEYALSPDTAFFVSVLGNDKSYDSLSPAPPPPVTTPPTPAGPLVNRDSKGYNIGLGANFDLTQVARGEIQFGYMNQSYDDSRFKDVDGLSALGRVEWFPTQLTTVTFAGSRSIEETPAIGAPSYISNNISAGVDHELLRNVLLSAQGSYGKDDYQGVDRTDKRTGAKASAAYLVNRRVGLFLTYTYLKQESSGTANGSSFKDNKLAASVALQF
jgi:hypothetical protein